MDKLGVRVGLEGPPPGLPSERSGHRRLLKGMRERTSYLGERRGLQLVKLPGQDGGHHHRCGHRHSLSCHMHCTCEGVGGDIKGIALHQLMQGT